MSDTRVFSHSIDILKIFFSRNSMAKVQNAQHLQKTTICLLFILFFYLS